MKSNKTFKIGELSKIFNIGPDSIRYYEKMGILHSYRNPENNYRYYSIEDFRTMTLIREMLGLGFSTKDIKDFVSDRNLAKTEEMLSKELSVIDAEIKRLEYTRSHLKNRLNSIIEKTTIYDKSESVRELTLPERKCIMVKGTNVPDNLVDYYLIKYMNKTENYVGTLGICDCYTLDLPGSNPESDYYRTKNVFFYSPSFSAERCNFTLPAGLYLSILYKGPLKKTKKLLPTLYEYAEKNNLSPSGDPIEFCHIDDYETSNEEEYLIEIQLPV